MRRFRSRLFDRKLNSPSSVENLALVLFKKEIEALNGVNAPASAHTVWQEFLSEIRSQFANNDPRSFLRWKIIRRAMCAEFQDFVTSEFNTLKCDPNWNTVWEPALQEVSIGHPRPWPYYRGRGGGFTSGNAIHHCFHLQQFEHLTRWKVSDFDSIFEFGAGYGSLCRIAHVLGFSGSYLIYDFPEFLALQRYYLRATGVLPNDSRDGSCRIKGFSEIDPAIREIVTSNGRNSLFIGLWSISEAGPGYIEHFFEALPKFDAYLIAFRRDFSGINNQVFFNAWRSALSSTHNCIETPAAGSNYDHYLFISPKDLGKTGTAIAN